MNTIPLHTDLTAQAVQTADLLGLKLAAAHLPGVVANLSQLHAIAAPLLEFPIGEHDEIAPVFVP